MTWIPCDPDSPPPPGHWYWIIGSHLGPDSPPAPVKVEKPPVWLVIPGGTTSSWKGWIDGRYHKIWAPHGVPEPIPLPKDEIRELNTVILTCDLPDAGLQAGAVGAVVHAYRTPRPRFEVEFYLPGGGSGIAQVSADQIEARQGLEMGDRPAGTDPVAAIRQLGELWDAMADAARREASE